MWLAQKNTSCTAVAGYDPTQCWVEAGYANSGGATHFFWSDVRPCNGCYYYEHDAGALASGDYGNNAFVGIDYNSANTWYVYAEGASTGISGYSTNNAMVPDRIQIGQELGGTSGVSTGVAHFTYNQWEGTDGNWHFQTNSGAIAAPGIGYPPFAWWTTVPAQGNAGGNWYTYSQ